MLGQQGATNESYSPSVAKGSGFTARVAKHEQDFTDRLRQDGHTAQIKAHGFRNAWGFEATKGHFGFVVKDKRGDPRAFVVDPQLVPQASELMARLSAENTTHMSKTGIMSYRKLAPFLRWLRQHYPVINLLTL